jgi:hypothetical protein
MSDVDSNFQSWKTKPVSRIWKPVSRIWDPVPEIFANTRLRCEGFHCYVDEVCPDTDTGYPAVRMLLVIYFHCAGHTNMYCTVHCCIDSIA